ncbi:hypothetical protein, partial [Pseudomonas syringae]|uniref:hypothetical protein n=1 Tax=Pseudomonas syringae TaxID=317 RepID=UPI001F293B97
HYLVIRIQLHRAVGVFFCVFFFFKEKEGIGVCVVGLGGGKMFKRDSFCLTILAHTVNNISSMGRLHFFPPYSSPSHS